MHSLTPAFQVSWKLEPTEIGCKTLVTGQLKPPLPLFSNVCRLAVKLHLLISECTDYFSPGWKSRENPSVKCSTVNTRPSWKSAASLSCCLVSHLSPCSHGQSTVVYRCHGLGCSCWSTWSGLNFLATNELQLMGWQQLQLWGQAHVLSAPLSLSKQGVEITDPGY